MLNFVIQRSKSGSGSTKDQDLLPLNKKSGAREQEASNV